MLMQTSMSELKVHDHYDRYAKLIDPSALEQLQNATLAPGWIPVELAHAHYAACDRLQLSPEQFAAVGQRVGDRMQNVVLVSLAKKVRDADYDLWQAVGPLQRMWPRIFQGGSVQLSKVGPKEMLLEEKGFSLNQHEYYRRAHEAAVTATYSAVRSNVTAKVLSYNAAQDEMLVHVTWI